jgi:LysM repeat protein
MDCAFWDWYWVSGGPRELKNWMKEGLARTDLIHLTSAGYKVKGKLFYDAIENSLNQMEKNKELNSLIIDINPIKNKKQNEPVLNDTLSTQLKIMDQIVKEKTISQKDTSNLETKKTENYIPENPISQKNESTQPVNSIQNTKPTESLNQPQQKEIQTKVIEKSTTEKIVNNEIAKVKIDSIRTSQKVITTNSSPKIIASGNKPQKINPAIKIISKEHFENTILVSSSSNTKPKTGNKNISSISESTNNNSQDYNAINETNQVNSKPTTQKSGTMIYKVKNGDNLSIIAAKFDISVNDIKKWNNLKNNNLSVGETLLIKR